MTKLVWGEYGHRIFEAGTDRGVLYVGTNPGVAWNGLTGISETAIGGEITPFYLEGVKYLNVSASEEYSATISAFSAPEEFAVCDGQKQIAAGLIATQQPRKKFGLSYRTLIGNDIEGVDLAYKIHCVYNAISTPSARSNVTLNSSPAPIMLSWGISVVPILINGAKATAHLIVDSRFADPTKLKAVEELLYGTAGTAPALPSPQDLITMLS